MNNSYVKNALKWHVVTVSAGLDTIEHLFSCIPFTNLCLYYKTKRKIISSEVPKYRSWMLCYSASCCLRFRTLIGSLSLSKSYLLQMHIEAYYYKQKHLAVTNLFQVIWLSGRFTLSVLQVGCNPPIVLCCVLNSE